MTKGLRQQRSAATSEAMADFLARCDRRWALRVIWELRGGALNFRDLRAACGGISPSVLQRRLHAWRAQGVIERVPRLGYRLTVPGEQLFLILSRLEKWASQRAGRQVAE